MLDHRIWFKLILNFCISKIMTLGWKITKTTFFYLVFFENFSVVIFWLANHETLFICVRESLTDNKNKNIKKIIILTNKEKMLIGIHAILKSGNKLSYVVYNLSTGRYVQDYYIPSDISSFLGLQPQNINLTSAGEVCAFNIYK